MFVTHLTVAVFTGYVIVIVFIYVNKTTQAFQLLRWSAQIVVFYYEKAIFYLGRKPHTLKVKNV